ncbi:MAG: energy-coupling factor ABC transporter substrate-binding protein [Methanobacteriaceae archaeon]|nr:energy-coupling factor ABC transporter substrate-binding protein [Methanobacteriaceae archaeon]
MEKKHILMLLAVAVITFIPLILYSGLGEDDGYFAGVDSNAGPVIEETGYRPWFEPIWEPPSGEIESLFFALQAAIGAFIIGYFMGYYKNKKKTDNQE